MCYQSEIQEEINSLRHKRMVWSKELGSERSAMKKSDINFLDRQIKKLEKLKDNVYHTLADVRASVDTRFDD